MTQVNTSGLPRLRRLEEDGNTKENAVNNAFVPYT